MSIEKSIAVIGCGYWGKNLVRVFHELGVLNTVCDSSEEAQNLVAERYPGALFEQNFENVISDERIRAISIATPAETHYSLTRQALEAGKDVLVEKPLVLDAKEGDALVELARKHGRVLMVGHLLWYHPVILKLKELISGGELGRIRYIASHRLNFGKIRREENVLWSFAPHDISVILGLVGDEPASVSCDGGAFLNDSIADLTSSSLTFSSGLKAHLFTSWLHPFKEQKLVVVGNKAMAVFDDVEPEDKLMLYDHSISWENNYPVARKSDGVPVDFKWSEPLKNECQHFLDRIVDRKDPRTDGAEGVRVLRVLKACQKSLETGQKVDLVPEAGISGHFVHESSYVDDGVSIGNGSKIWHFCNVMKGSVLGERCIVGQNVTIGPNAKIGDNVKIQNNVSVFEGVELGDDVFCGPSMVFTNVANPRSLVSRRHEFKKTIVKKGATLGANCTIVCGNSIGEYAFVAAGAVVAKSVSDYALVAGVPAKRIGWMSAHGCRLGAPNEEGLLVCPESGKSYRLTTPEALIEC